MINAESADIDENEDINGTADTNENSILSQLEYGGEVTGFAVTFSTGGEENTGEIITYIINPKYTSAAVLAQQNRQEQIEKAKNSSGDATGDKNGNKDNSTCLLYTSYEILELARTGITGLTRGSADVTYLD